MQDWTRNAIDPSAVYTQGFSPESSIGPAVDGVHRAIKTMVDQVQHEREQLLVRIRQEEATYKAHSDRAIQLEAEINALRGAMPGSQLPAKAPVAQGYPQAPPISGSAGFSGSAGNAQGAGFSLVKEITAHDQPVHSVAIPRQLPSRQSRAIVASASWDGAVNLYNLQNLCQSPGSKDSQVVSTLGGSSEMGGLYSVAFAKTEATVLGCTSADKSVYLWNHVEGKRLHKLSGHTDEVNGIDFHHQQNVMCTASDDCKAIIWDFGEGITLRTLAKHTKAVYGATFLGQEHQYCVATCCFDKKIRIFDMRDKQVVAELEGTHTDDIIGIDYTSLHTPTLATGSDDGLVALYDPRKWKPRETVNTHDHAGRDNEVKRVAFSLDGKNLAAACSSQKVLVYNVEGGIRHRATLEGHTDCVFDVAWGTCPDTQADVIVSASHDKTSRVWRADKM